MGGQQVSVGLLPCASSRSKAERAGEPGSSGEDLTADYHDLAVAVQGLGFLESGITDQLNHFSNTLLEFSALLRHTVRRRYLRWARRYLEMTEWFADAKRHRSLPRSLTFPLDVFACSPRRLEAA